MSGRRPEVAIVQSWVPHYRQPFYEGLRDRLADDGVDLHVVHGRAFGDQALKDDTVVLPWATLVPTRTLSLGPRTLSWRAAGPRVAQADLVIATQKSANLENYAFLARQVTGRQRFALWGHGRNFQDASPLGERLKRVMSTHVHWWFAYNELSAAVVRDLPFPEARTTVVNNAIDTRGIRRRAARTTAADLRDLRLALDLRGSHVGAFVGGLYEEKRLPFLIAAADEIRSRIGDFELVIIGGGPQLAVVQQAAATRSWLHVMGPRFDEEKVRLLQLADVLLMPGLVGLAILDAFALGLPLATVADSAHSPEIDYLVDGVNGVCLPAGTDARGYARAVADLLTDRPRLQHLASNGRRAGEAYTIEEMVMRFADGVLRALDTSPAAPDPAVPTC